MSKMTCPYWLGFLLVSPTRRLFHAPEAVLGPYLKPGATAIDVGCAMGYFSLAMAEAVGPNGRVICVDLQERMLGRLRKRAARAGVADRIETRVCGPDDLGLGDLEGQADFALAFAMVHEAEDPAKLFAQIHRALRPGGRLLIAEPSGHVSRAEFDREVGLAREAGFSVVPHEARKRPRLSALLRKE